MKMNASTEYIEYDQKHLCTHDELLSLDQQHSYTAISNETMFHLLSNRAIASALKLWLLIRYKQSGFSDRVSYTVTVRELSNKLGVGKSTIQNWQRILVSEGYLEIKERKTGLKSNLANQYRACLPKEIHEKLKTNRRRMNKKEKTFDQQAESTDNSLKQRRGRKRQEDTRPSEKRNEVYVCSIKNLSGGDQQDTNGHTSAPENTLGKERKQLIIQVLSNLGVRRWLALLCEGLTMTTDTVGTLTIHNVPDHARKPLTEAFQSVKTDLIDQLKELNGDVRMLSTHTKPKSKGEPRIRLENSDVDDTAAAKPKKRESNKPAISMCKATKRVITVHTKQRIHERLKNLEHNNRPLFAAKQIEQLTAEITYAISQGAFAAAPITKSINICLKLINQNRWTMPHGFKQQTTNK